MDTQMSAGHTAQGTATSAASYTKSPRGNSGGTPKMAIIISVVILLLVIIGGFIVVRSRTGGEDIEPSPTTVMFESVASPTPKGTPQADVSPIPKTELKASILNGTGIPREAAYLQGVLGGLGYENIEVGNADADTYTAAIAAFSDQVSASQKEEILDKLNDVYSEVEEADDPPGGDVDIHVITGGRPGVFKPTPRPAATPEVEGASDESDDDEDESSPSPTAQTSPEPTP